MLVGAHPGGCRFGAGSLGRFDRSNKEGKKQPALTQREGRPAGQKHLRTWAIVVPRAERAAAQASIRPTSIDALAPRRQSRPLHLRFIAAFTPCTGAAGACRQFHHRWHCLQGRRASIRSRPPRAAVGRRRRRASATTSLPVCVSLQVRWRFSSNWFGLAKGSPLSARGPHRMADVRAVPGRHPACLR